MANKQSDPSKRAKNSRRRGHQFERDVANKFKAAGYTKAMRQLEYQVSDDLGVDLSGTEPYAIQCKRLAKYASINMIKEIKPREGRIPVLVTQADRDAPMAVLPLEHFLKLIEVKNELHEQ